MGDVTGSRGTLRDPGWAYGGYGEAEGPQGGLGTGAVGTLWRRMEDPGEVQQLEQGVPKESGGPWGVSG